MKHRIFNVCFGIWFAVVTFTSFLSLFYFIEEVIECNRDYESAEISICTDEPAQPVQEIDILANLVSAEFNEAYFPLTDDERAIAEKIVMGEAGGESYEGQVLVAQCLVNAAIKDGLQPSEIRTEYQYSGWNDNPSESVKMAVSAVFDDGYKYIDEPVLYFYAPKLVESNWHESLDFVIEHGNHRFFKE